MSEAHAGTTGNTSEYINDFLFFVVKPDQSREKGVYTYCSGANLYRFLPITKGRHGLASNSALRGLQLVNLGIRNMAREKGITIKPLRGNCAGIAAGGDGWYSELLLIENAPESFPEEIITYGAITLLKKILKACMLQDPVPDTLPGPEELQRFIEGLCDKYRGSFDLRDARNTNPLLPS
ncbi:MAG: hypothetical protein K8I29_17590 [Alphaproteobacteria bacterium]|uniref:Uncharacterized protein n=1 Tax=Candidatus Nitrobium versatile TaxID=2884831 RepID=A0A953M2Z0_9BACT|nr:hypothetical protein [Candidatus Nitrobium versatile]